MKMFLDNGYLDVGAILAARYPFVFIVGGRGIGKTYGMLKYALDNEIFFMYMRRTQTQTDMVNKEEFNPFNAINADDGRQIIPRPFTKWNSVFEDTALDPARPVGYSAALSTMANMRSFDASAVNLLIYDEFIPEKHERPIKFEGVALLNAYESVNRNRELKGRPPLTMVCCANANDMANAIFLELDIVNDAMKMTEKGQRVKKFPERGLMIINLDITPIGEKKKETALYKLTGARSEFSRMALENDYSFEEIGRIQPQPLKEYEPLASVGGICIYRHKSDRRYYVCSHVSGSPATFTTGEADLKRFRKQFYYLWWAYLDNSVIFQNYLTQVLFEKYIK